MNENLLNKIINKEEILYLNPQEGNEILNYFLFKKSECLDNGKYVEAQEFEDYCNEVRHLLVLSQFNEERKKKYEEILIKIEESKKELINSKIRQENLLKQLENIYKTELDFFEENQKKELIDFEMKTKPSPKFLKYSPEYIELRRKENFLVSSKRFIEAIPIKEEADKLQIFENEKNSKNWEIHFNKLKNQFLLKQKQQKDCFETNWQRKNQSVIVSAEKEVEKNELTIKSLEIKLKDFNNQKKNINEKINSNSNLTRIRMKNYKNKNIKK